MQEPLHGRTAVLVIRLWIEGDLSTGLRARITRTLDVTEPEQLSTPVANREEIEEIVLTWLDEYIALADSSVPKLG